MNPIDVKTNTYIDYSKEINKLIKLQNLKLVIMLEYQNIKIFLQKVKLQIGLKKFLWLEKLKIQCRGHMFLMILIEKKLLERFTKISSKTYIKNSLELKK